MDPETLQFYNAHAPEIAGSYAAAGSGVAVHLPEEQRFDTVFNIRRILTPGGRLLLSPVHRGVA